MTLVNLNLKIYDALTSALCKAQQRAQQGNDFLRIFHNGRSDAFLDAKDIINDILQSISEDILLTDPWTPVSSNLPEGHCKRVLISPPDKEYGPLAYCSNNEWFSDSNQKIPTPNSWMYIPKEPKS
jgi:hypothetical protein